MNTDQFKRAKEILDEIQELENHKQAIKIRLDRDCKMWLLNSQISSEMIRSDFMPLTQEQFFTLYVSKLNQRIFELETEFNNL